MTIFDLDYIVNYVTPGYATAVYVYRQRRGTDPDHRGEPSSNRHHRGHGQAFRLYRARIGLRASGHHSRAGTSS